MKFLFKIFFIILLFCNQCLSQTSNINQEENIFVSQFKQQIEKARQGFIDAKNFLRQFPSYIRNFHSYAGKITSNNINEVFKQASLPAGSYFSSNIVLAKKGIGGLVIDFGYEGAGLLQEPFNDIKVKIDFEKIPNFLENAVMQALMNIPFINQVLDIRAQNVFLLKFFLLSLDLKKQAINSRQFIIQTLLLFWRLAKVKGFNNLNDLFGGTNNPFALILNNVKISGNSVSMFLNDKWKEYKDIAKYSFAIEEKPAKGLTKADLIETNDWTKIIKGITTIGLHTMADYSDVKAKFFKTTRGKQFKDKLISAATRKEQLIIIKEMNKVMPGFQSVQEKMQKRMVGFLRRIKGIRRLVFKFKAKLEPLLKPICDEMGISYDAIFPIQDLEKEKVPGTEGGDDTLEDLPEEEWDILAEEEDWGDEF